MHWSRSRIILRSAGGEQVYQLCLEGIQPPITKCWLLAGVVPPWSLSLSFSLSLSLAPHPRCIAPSHSTGLMSKGRRALLGSTESISRSEMFTAVSDNSASRGVARGVARPVLPTIPLPRGTFHRKNDSAAGPDPATLPWKELSARGIDDSALLLAKPWPGQALGQAKKRSAQTQTFPLLGTSLF